MPPADSCADKVDSRWSGRSEFVAMRVAACTDRGQRRSTNEDAYWADPPWFAVADGMGGHRAGEVASRLAIETVKEQALLHRGATARDLVAMVEEANRRIWEASRTEPDFVRRMGTTLTLMHVEFPRCLIAHVGDSRAYVFRNGRLRQLTSDHSVVAELIRSGNLSEDEAAFHPQRNVLTRALGMAEELDVDVIQEQLFRGDSLLLCTDGLSSVVEKSRIEAILEHSMSPAEAGERLVAEANAKGGPDNITVVVVEIPAHEEPA